MRRGRWAFQAGRDTFAEFPGLFPAYSASLIARPSPAPSRAPSPCGLDVPPGAKARGLWALQPLGAARDRFLAALENSSGPRRIFLRIREERPILAPLPRPPARPRENCHNPKTSGCGVCGARFRSRLRAGALRARPRFPRPPLLRSPCGLASVEAARRWHGRCLRRFRRGRGTGALPT